MKLTADRNTLLSDLRLVAPAVAKPGRTGVAALMGVRIHATKKTATLTAADLDVTLETDLDCDVDDPGTTVVPHRVLTSIIAKLPAGPVTLTADAAEIHIEAQGVDATLRAFDADTWPKLPTAETGESAKLDHDDWLAICGVASAASTEDSRPILTGVHLAEGTAVATDSYRCAWVDIDSLGGLDVLIPASSITAVDPGEGPIVVSVDGQVVSIATDTVTATMRSIAGEFPKWRSLLPTPKAHVRVGRDLLAEAFAAVDVVTDHRPKSKNEKDRNGNGPAKLTQPEPGIVNVEKIEADVGDMRVTLPCDGELPVTVALNPTYARSMLALVDTDDVTIGIVDALKPVSFAAGERTVGILMPIRVA